MPLDLSRFIDTVDPARTVLLFGAGSSVPSGAPSGSQLSQQLALQFGLPPEGYTFNEIASLIEQRTSRGELVAAVRERFRNVRPTRGLLNLPLYPWRSLYTTNYDDLIEQCYQRQSKALLVYSSNFDFTVHDDPLATKLFKLHGTLERDISDGGPSRLILTDSDNDLTEQYREALYDRLKGDVVGGHLVIIGHSLQDQDIRQMAQRAATLSSKASAAWRISLFLYERDEQRASLFEVRGFNICFGGIDDFFSGLAARTPPAPAAIADDDPLSSAPALRPSTIDTDHASRLPPDVSAMFNGWPASHSDVVHGLTFERSIADEVITFLAQPDSTCATILGASGLGKTTAARQIAQRLRHSGSLCWEHVPDFTLQVAAWLTLAGYLKTSSRKGVLIVDDAHAHLQEINDLVDGLVAGELDNLKVILISSRNHWNPRVKTPNIYKFGREFWLGKLNGQEIERLLTLVDANAEIRALVEQTFAGFSRYERYRRLVERCESETFVCLKNIFASEKFDDIILREYAALPEPYQDIYRHVAAMESAGIRVHRQLVIRLLGIPAGEIGNVLLNLRDIVQEYTINEREGIYGWRGRHQVIVSIIARYKYPDPIKLAELFSRVIDNISPTYDIEVRTIRELCNLESGLPNIPDKNVQNTLLRKMMSAVPGERVPRHRLIRNLIEMGEFEKAETEIRIFDKDFGRDGPVARYKVALLTARATKTPGILDEDRRVILDQAKALAVDSIRRFPNNKALLVAYCDVGIEIYRSFADYTVYDEAIAQLKQAEERIGDPDITRLIARYEARIRGREREHAFVEEEQADAQSAPEGAAPGESA